MDEALAAYQRLQVGRVARICRRGRGGAAAAAALLLQSLIGGGGGCSRLGLGLGLGGLRCQLLYLKEVAERSWQLGVLGVIDLEVLGSIDPRLQVLDPLVTLYTTHG